MIRAACESCRRSMASRSFPASFWVINSVQSAKRLQTDPREIGRAAISNRKAEPVLWSRAPSRRRLIPLSIRSWFVRLTSVRSNPNVRQQFHELYEELIADEKRNQLSAMT